MKSTQVTIKDIAKALGVSPSTVSRALKNHPDISLETRKAVNELALRLKYEPNAIALSLKQSRSSSIGVIIPEMVHYFFSSVLSGIADVAYDAGFTVIICQSNEMHEREVANVKALYSHRVDGILISISKDSDNTDHLIFLNDNDIPLVFFDRYAPGISCDKVIVDDFDAAFKATKHLIEIGRRRIAHFCGAQKLVIGRERLEGYKKALKDVRLPIDETLIFPAENFEMAREAVGRMLELPVRPDGLFAVNDLTAIGAMITLQKRGIKIPDDIAIVGFSDGRFSGIVEPNLSSVDQHGYEMGTTAARLLIKRILSEDPFYPPETVILQSSLIIRGSSRPDII
jgi:DNA-binding LacI/PurR family transcriptional regulator